MSRNHRAGCSQLPVQCITAGLASPQRQLEMGHRTSLSASGLGLKCTDRRGEAAAAHLHLPSAFSSAASGKSTAGEAKSCRDLHSRSLGQSW